MPPLLLLMHPPPAASENFLQKVGQVAHDAVEKTGEVLHKAVDATILDKSPHGTMVDGTPCLDGAMLPGHHKKEDEKPAEAKSE